MDRGFGYILFLLCFIGSIWGGMLVLDEIQSRLSAIEFADGLTSPNSTNTQLAIDKIPSDLWFKSHLHEIEADSKMRSGNTKEARNEIKAAIEVMEQVKRNHASFRPIHVDHRLARLKEYLANWGQVPISVNRPNPETVDHFPNPGSDPEVHIEPRVVASTTIALPEIESPKVGMSRIIKGTAAKEEYNFAGEYPEIGERVEHPVIANATIEFPVNEGYQVDVPKIGSGHTVGEETPGFIKIKSDDPAIQDWRPPTPPSVPAKRNDAHSLLSPDPDFPEDAATNRSQPEEVELVADPSSIWYRAFLSFESGRELESQGKKSKAREKYIESKQYYDLLDRDFPEMQSAYIKTGIRRLEQKLNSMDEKPNPHPPSRPVGKSATDGREL